MKKRHYLIPVSLLAAGLLWIAASDTPQPDPLPYAQAGLTEREAAAHLLSRFTYGARPGDIDNVVEMGLETWLDRQLRADFSDKTLEKKLRPFNALNLTASEMAETYPNPARLLRMAQQEGDYSQEELADMSQQDRRRTLRAYMEANGLKSQRDLVGQLIGQKVMRAVYSENQLQEVLTDFWFNHFNVALQDNQARAYLLPYERDAIRPYVFDPFRDMLGATAKHPAMLHYLDNAQSSSPDSVPNTMNTNLQRLEEQPGWRGRVARRSIEQGRQQMQRHRQEAMQDIPENVRPRRGINENYARELMELHTLGVDGGYTQKDVEEVARALTGWTTLPIGDRADQVRSQVERRGARVGFVLEDPFLFRADAHDATPKTILGHYFPSGGGVEEGERVLDIVAQHPSTAHHMATKLATRFVSDAPPQELIEDLTSVFLETQGNLTAVMQTLAHSPHFWSEDAQQSKVKSPFELTISSLRALDADVRPTRELVEWVDKMGQPLYRYLAPTGYPDEADFWINAGALLNRMNFGLELATGQIAGVQVDLLALNQNREPGSVEEALATYVPLLLPERDAAAIVDFLLPMAQDSGLAEKLKSSTVQMGNNEANEMDMNDMTDLDADFDNTATLNPFVSTDPASLARVVGVILSSPEFQRR